jgi:hypothetical protein
MGASPGRSTRPSCSGSTVKSEGIAGRRSVDTGRRRRAELRREVELAVKAAVQPCPVDHAASHRALEEPASAFSPQRPLGHEDGADPGAVLRRARGRARSQFSARIMSAPSRFARTVATSKAGPFASGAAA